MLCMHNKCLEGEKTTLHQYVALEHFLYTLKVQTFKHQFTNYTPWTGQLGTHSLSSTTIHQLHSETNRKAGTVQYNQRVFPVTTHPEATPVVGRTSTKLCNLPYQSSTRKQFNYSPARYSQHSAQVAKLCKLMKRSLERHKEQLPFTSLCLPIFQAHILALQTSKYC